MENYYGENQNFDSGGENNNNFPPNQNLNKGQKIAVGALAVFAVFIIFMWSSSLKQSISSPFAYQGEAPASSPATSNCAGGDCLFEENLKFKDTDGDGLSDWDELYVYGTSPYLMDTSGDGISDLEAIKMGIDPNCPRGRDCSYFSAEENLFSDQISVDSLFSTLDQSAGTEPPAVNEQEILSLIMDGSVSVRDLFLQSGEFDKEFLDQYTDDELLEAYLMVLAEEE